MNIEESLSISFSLPPPRYRMPMIFTGNVMFVVVVVFSVNTSEKKETFFSLSLALLGYVI